MGSTLAEAPIRLIAAVERVVDQQYLGFDTNIYPGDRTMKIWADDGTYDWVGYYLPAPCHRDTSWSGKRDTLISMGWGLAVVYVGQQVWKRLRRSPEEGRDVLQPVHQRRTRRHRGSRRNRDGDRRRVSRTAP